MKTLIAAALCASALTAVSPAASAQPYGPGPGQAQQPGHGFREQLDALDARVQAGIRNGDIDRGEADRANRELGSIRGEMERMRAEGGGQLSDMDRGRLHERLDALSRSIHWMREQGPGAGPGAGPGPGPGPGYPPPRPGAGPGPGVYGDWSLARREGWLQAAINHGRADGSLSRRETYRIQQGPERYQGHADADDPPQPRPAAPR